MSTVVSAWSLGVDGGQASRMVSVLLHGQQPYVSYQPLTCTYWSSPRLLLQMLVSLPSAPPPPPGVDAGVSWPSDQLVQSAVPSLPIPSLALLLPYPLLPTGRLSPRFIVRLLSFVAGHTLLLSDAGALLGGAGTSIKSVFVTLFNTVHAIIITPMSV